MKHIKLTFLVNLLFFFLLSNAQTGLVAHWSFDSIANNQFIDHVTNEIGGTVYGCESIPGPVGNALGFDGINDYARIPGDGLPPPTILSELSEGSISVWFKVENIPTTFGIRPIFYYGNEIACNFFDAANEGMIIEVGHSPIHLDSRRLYFTEWTNGCTYPSFCYDSGNPLSESQWYHYVAVVGIDFNTGYLNGQLMTDRHYNFGNSQTTEFFADALAHETLWIGKGHWDTDDMFFKGAIDEVKIFDHALNQQEIDALYAEGNLLSVIEKEGIKKVEVHLYPNPAKSIINLDIPGSLNSSMIFLIYNDSGVLVFQYKGTELKKSNVIDLRGLPKGIYYYSLKDKTGILNSDNFIIQ
jgi:hypothetical protein